jgi:hypothetical protein
MPTRAIRAQPSTHSIQRKEAVDVSDTSLIEGCKALAPEAELVADGAFQNSRHAGGGFVKRVCRLACVVGVLGVSLVCFIGEAAPAVRATPNATAPVKVIRGWVQLSAFAPVRGARVTLETVAGKPIATFDQDALPITNKAGAFSLRAVALPKRFVVVAHGGKAAGTSMSAPLRAKVFGHHPLDLVRVNVLTTVAAKRQARHPYEPYNATVARVRQLLSIPSWHTVDRDASASPEFFDGVRFATYARAHGGMTAFLARLQRELESARPAARDFHGRRPALTHNRALAGVSRSMEDDDLSTFVLGALAKGVIGGIGNNLFGSILKQIGLTSDPDAAVMAQLSGIQTDLKNIAAQLVTLQSSFNTDFDALSSQVSQASYNTVAGTLNPYKTLIDTAIGNIKYIADTPTDSTNAGTANKTLQAIRNNLAPFASAYNTALTPGAPGTSNLLTLAQQNFYASAKLNQPLIGGSGLSQQAQDVYEYYAAYEAQLVELLVESDNAANASSNSIMSLDIVPALGAPATASSAATLGYLDNWQAELLPPLPPYVFADLRTGRIWSILNASTTDCSLSLSSLGGMWTAGNVGLHSPDPGSPITCTFPVGGYSMPAMADLLALTAGWNATPAKDGSHPSDVLAWLTTQTGPTGMPTYIGTVQPAAGFLQGPYVRSGSNGTPWAFWSSTCSYDGNTYVLNGGVSTGYGLQYFAGGGFTSCQILDLATGATTVECVADSIAGNYLGCEAPLFASTNYSGPITQHACAPCGLFNYGDFVLASGTQLDYFHPNLVLGWRTPNAGEQYWTAP